MRRSIALAIVFFCFMYAGAAHGQGCIGNGGALKVNPAGASFGKVAVGSSASKVLVIQNVSSVREFLGINSITPEDAQYSIKLPQTPPICVPPGQSIQVTVFFAPTRSGTTNSQLKVLSTAKTSPDFILVSGTGTGGSASLKVSPSSLSFGEVGVGQKLAKTFNILNQGGSAATIDQVSSNNSAFSVTTTFPKSIAPGGQIPVNVSFAPVSQGPANATLSVKSGGQTVATVAVSGTGKGGNPDISVSSTQLDFGTFDIGTYRDKPLSISNKGVGDLQVTLLPAVQLVVTPAGPLTIAPGRSVALKIRLIADAEGPISKILKLNSNDPDEAHVDVSLKAVGSKGKLGLLDITDKSHIGNNTNDTTGVQWVDYNGDGKEDLFLTGHNGNFLFKNLGGNQFANVTNQAKLGNGGRDCRGASWADVDNDGDLDVFLANFSGPATIMKNNKGVFADQGAGLGLFSADNTSSSQGGIWLDFNNDGRIDLLVVKDGKPNQLFKQTGLFRFTDVASSAGIAINTAGRSAVAADFNNDGYQDIYIANANHPNKLYINRKNETFADMTQSAGVGFTGASESVAATDYDGDGDLDLFVANSDGTSVLYRNTGNLKFQNATAAAGLNGPKNATAATFTDFDNDGDQDLLIVQAPGENVLYRNIGKGKFVKSNVDVSRTTSPSSTSTGDSNNNGTPDVVVGGGGGSDDSAYDNSGGNGSNWLTVVLQGTVSNRAAIGAKVILRAGVLIQAKLVSSGNGQSQDSLPLEFGLGSLSSASLIIAWPSGRIQTLENVAVNQKLKVTEPSN